MKNTLIRVFTLLITTALLITWMPVSSFAEALEDSVKTDAETVNTPGYIEVDDGYLQIRVSEKNGGFYVGTLEGDKMVKSDNNKFLLYPDSYFDTSFTSFRVTRDGQKQEYIFGRDYSYLGLECSPVTVFKNADNAITAQWTVDGLRFTQIIALMGQDTYQHGMAYVSYTVENLSGSAVEDVQARVMLDTALGYQDYAYYMLGQTNGSYVSVNSEKTVVGTGYSNYFFAYDSETAPTVTAYMLNATVGGETVVPEKVTFAHWNNLASTVFDYQPDEVAPLDFTNQYNLDFMTADSAVAMYYSMGSAAAGESGKGIGFYYGVYSNFNAGDADVTMNFTSSGTMYLNEDGLTYKDINGSLPGNFSTTIKLQNVGEDSIKKLKLAIYPGEELLPYSESGRLIENASLQDPYYREITDLRVGEARDIRLDFKIDPTYVTDYRKIKLVVYDASNTNELTEANTVLSKEIYVLCPGSDNAELGFSGMTPSTVFMTGRRFVYVTGSNFNLLRDKSQYRLVLRPLDGGDDVVLDQDLVVVNPEKNTATLVLDQELRKGTWQLIIDWNDATVEDIVNDALRITVTDVPGEGDPGFVSSGIYGIVAIERSGKGNKTDPYHYEIVNYESESAFRNTKTEPKDIMLVLRGDFNVLSDDERGIFQAEALTLMAGDVITISDALEVKDGRVTVTVEFDGDGKQKAINVDIDGKVRTANGKTKVWDGVCAITSFNEGTLYTLPVYDDQGNLEYDEDEIGGKEITLLWPSAAGAAQTLVGLLFDLRYGEFALMEQGNKLERVIAFGAKLDPQILVPNGAVGNYGISKQEQAHQDMANKNYTSADLRISQMYNEAEEKKWRAAQVGTLNIYVDDILFGGGGFIGFNTQVEVGIPSYAQGLPYIEGTLALKIINDYWEFGVEGSADAIVFEMEASLQLKSYNGIPVPDKVYFYVGGFDPGVLVDPIGMLWIRGAGGGVDNIYDTFFVSNVVPPLTLLISGSFAIFSVLEARADVALSFRGIEAYLNNIKFGTVTILDSFGGKLYWYPSFEAAIGVKLNILDAIIGEGSIMLQVDYDGNVFFQAYAKATIQIPKKIFLIGGTKLGEVSIGLDTKKVWGSAKIIGIGVGIVYYWGGSVNITTGKKVKVPEPEFYFGTDLDGLVYVDPETGEELYMSVINGVRNLSDGSLENTVIESSADKKLHSFTLDVNSNEDGLAAISFPAASRVEAESLKHGIKVKVGDSEYPLEWFNDAYDADDAVNLGTNALLNYDEETGMAYVSVSFTDGACFGKKIEISTPASSDIELFAVERLVDFDSVQLVDNEGDDNDRIVVTGRDLEKLSALTVQAVDADGNAYLLKDENVELITGDTHETRIIYPENLPTGDYTLRVVGTVVKDGIEIACPMIETSFSYVNAEQPEPLTDLEIALGGNYTVEAHVNSNNLSFDGYSLTVYEKTEDGLVPTIYSDILYEITESERNENLLERSLITGGRYSSTDSESGETVFNGLEAGKTYVVEARTYKLMDDESMLYSTAIFSDEIEMVAPIATNPTFSIDGASTINVGSTSVTVDTINKNSFTIKVGGVDSFLSGTYQLNREEAVEWDGGDIVIDGLEDGTYTLTLSGVNGTKDSFSGLYQFTVDTSAPDMMISSPQGGGFFDNGSVRVTGMTEAGAKIVAGAIGGETVSTVANESGAFEIVIPLDEHLAYQDIRVYAEDSVGNRSMPFGCTLTNSLLGENGLRAAIFIDGEQVDSVASSDQAKQLRMGFVSGDRYAVLNESSVASARVYWRTSMIQKSATVSDSGVLLGDEGAVGLVIATLDNFTAVAKLSALDVAEAEISLIVPEGGLVYDGEEKRPAISFGGYEEMVEGVDYSVSYYNNVNAGTATAVIEAIGEGKINGIKLLNFEIEARDIADVEIKIEEGGLARPAVSVSFGGKSLTKGTDYEVEYVINANRNTVIVNVEGIGNFKNVASYSLEIDTSLGGVIKNFFNDIKYTLNEWLAFIIAGGGVATALVAIGGILAVLLLVALVVVIVILKKKNGGAKGKKSPDPTPEAKVENGAEEIAPDAAEKIEETETQVQEEQTESCEEDAPTEE